MRKVLMVMFSTLDGRAQFPITPPPATPEEADEEDPMWKPRFDSIDTLLLGRKSYEAWSAFWPKRKDDPTAGTWQKEFSRFADRCRKVVFSKSLKEATWVNSEIVRGSPREVVAALRKKKGRDLALGGGPRLAQSFLADELVDEMLIEVFPSIVEKGKPFFHTIDDPDFPEDRIPIGAPGRHDFRLLEAKPLSDGTLFLRYERAK